MHQSVHEMSDKTIFYILFKYAIAEEICFSRMYMRKKRCRSETGNRYHYRENAMPKSNTRERGREREI